MNLKILTYNLGLLRISIYGVKVFEFTPFLEERFKMALQNLNSFDFDIICLQEVYSRKDAKLIHDTLTSKYPYNVFYHAEKKWKWSSGLVVLSRYPIPYADFKKYEKSTLDERLFVDKGFLETEIQLQKHKVHLINCHTTAGGYFYHPEHPHTNKIREQQIHQMIRRAHERENDVSIISGDLNAGPKVSKNNFEIFKFYQYRDIFNYQEGHITWDIENPLNKQSFHATSPNQRIDHILYKPMNNIEVSHGESKILFQEPVVEVKSEKITASDHYAVASELFLSNS